MRSMEQSPEYDLDYSTYVVPKITSDLELAWKLNGLELRRMCIDFGRCFATGSVAGGSLRSRNAAEKLNESMYALKTLSLVNIGRQD